MPIFHSKLLFWLNGNSFGIIFINCVSWTLVRNEEKIKVFQWNYLGRIGSSSDGGVLTELEGNFGHYVCKIAFGAVWLKTWGLVYNYHWRATLHFKASFTFFPREGIKEIRPHKNFLSEKPQIAALFQNGDPDCSLMPFPSKCWFPLKNPP